MIEPSTQPAANVEAGTTGADGPGETTVQKWSPPEFLVLLGMLGLAGVGFALHGAAPAYVEAASTPLVLNTLLGIGLYASVAGINLDAVRRDVPTIVGVVTIGVLLKCLIIGAIVFAVTKSWIAFAFAIVVAQIDPLSVSALTNQRAGRLSERGKGLLLAWASFDDPITVLAAFAATTVLWGPVGAPISQFIGSGQWADLALYAGNVIAPLIAWGASRAFDKSHIARSAVLIILFVGCVGFGWMLGIALTALFLRPFHERRLGLAVNVAFIASLLLVGANLALPAADKLGETLATIAAVAGGAVLAQAVVAPLLAWNFPARDKLFLAFAQQNGITALILALYFSQYDVPGVVPIVAGAVFAINAFHLVAFQALGTQKKGLLIRRGPSRA